ncbi:MAG: hypothetical protein JNJ69_09150 [Leptospiraceae bacterium]|nr:hypothetical protein [Leptospiraceae bacterium]
MENEPKGYLSKLLLWIKTKHVTLFASALAVAIAIYGAKAIGSPVKAKPIPEGWVFRGQSLATADNQILPGGDILQLPEKLTLKALTDCAVRIAPKNKSGMQQVHLLYGTALITRHDGEFPVVIQSATKAFRLTGTRFILQSSASQEKLFLIDGQIEFLSGKKTETLTAGQANMLLIQSGNTEIKKSPPAELVKLFPDLAGVLKDLDVRPNSAKNSHAALKGL